MTFYKPAGPNSFEAMELYSLAVEMKMKTACAEPSAVTANET